MTNIANGLRASIETFADTYAGQMFAKRIATDVGRLSEQAVERKVGFDAGA